MAEDREKISNGPNERAVNEAIAGTGPGIADDALSPGQDMPEAPSDEEVERVRRKLEGEASAEDELPVEGQ